MDFKNMAIKNMKTDDYEEERSAMNKAVETTLEGDGQKRST